MTDDIVIRLRNDECYGTHYEPGDSLGCTPCEAADEIERLRADRNRWRVACESIWFAVVDGQHRSEIEDRDAEIERLQNELDRKLVHMDALLDDNVELMAKVASLEAVISGRFESTSITQEVRGE